jgi:glycosyltransferase involved in cell wall biosynthesis
MTSGGRHVDDSLVPAVPRAGGLRVLQVVDSLSGGGAERHVVDLAVALRRRRHEVAVASSTGGVLAPALDAEGIAAHQLVDRLVKRRSSVRYARSLARLVEWYRPDVVHAHIYASAFAAAAATMECGVPLVLTEHTEAPWRPPRARMVSWWVYQRARHIVAVSSAIERLLRRRYRVPAERISVLLPAVPAAQDPTPGPADPTVRPLIGRVARLEPEKGVDVFLRGAALVAARCANARFVVIGDGSLRDQLVALGHDLGLTDRVDFTGFRPDARRLIAQLDVLVVSSHSDGSPLVVLEALEAGVPVVGTGVGGLPDQIRHGREGLLVPPGEPDRLAAAILRLLGDSSRARAMGAAGRRRAAELGHDRMVDRLETIYQSVRTR